MLRETITEAGDHVVGTPTRTEASFVGKDGAATVTIGYQKGDGTFKAYADGLMGSDDAYVRHGANVQLMVQTDAAVDIYIAHGNVR